MSLTKQIAKHFREVHFGGNWTCVNLKDSLAGLSWQEATMRVYGCNTIATLVYHALPPGTNCDTEKNNPGR